MTIEQQKQVAVVTLAVLGGLIAAMAVAGPVLARRLRAEWQKAGGYLLFYLAFFWALFLVASFGLIAEF